MGMFYRDLWFLLEGSQKMNQMGFFHVKSAGKFRFVVSCQPRFVSRSMGISITITGVLCAC